MLYIANGNDPIRLDNLLNINKIPFSDIFNYERGGPLVSFGAWCLMTNHFHLLVKEQVAGGISLFMKKLGTGYSMFFNLKHDRVGALFEGPFKSRLVSEDSHLKHLFGYIHLNPLDIEFSGWNNRMDRPKNLEWKAFLTEYPYSSFHDLHSTERPEHKILNLADFPGYFKKRPEFQDFVDSYLAFDVLS